MADDITPWIQYTLCAHNFGLTVEAILMDLHNHNNIQITIKDIRNIIFCNSQIPKEQYQWYNWEYRASSRNLPQTSYPWNAWTARYAHRCKLNNMANSAIWQHMLSRGYELPIDMPIHAILNAREFIENHLLAVCQNPIALAEVYIPTVLRAHSWGYTLNEILQGIFLPDNLDGTDMSHLRNTLDSHGVEMGMQRLGRSFCSTNTVIVEGFVGSAFMIGMRVDEISDLCYAHGFDIRHAGLVENILVRLGMLNHFWVRVSN